MPLMKMTPAGEVPMTKDEEAAHLADQEAMTARTTSDQLKRQARVALDTSDRVFLRCGKAGVAWPAEWQAYVVTLRAIFATGSGAMPDCPAYPLES